ncbi:hypothetical protein BC943DRAFT_82993 [Umbelopsis sp. AD052]|nr:hypothetical protein BC943DRAFT_82993 [Umbelopsis sp. AD052]
MAWQAQGEHDGVRAQLHDYIYDYLVKMNFKDTAFAFADESKINTSNTVTNDSKKNGDSLSAALDSMDTSARVDHTQKSPHSNKKRTPANLPNVKVPFDAPGGFLYEWWVIFWEVFAAKNNRSTNRDAIAYVEAQQRLKRQQMLGMLQQQQLLRLQQHAAQQVYQAQDQSNMQQMVRPTASPVVTQQQQMARGGPPLENMDLQPDNANNLGGTRANQRRPNAGQESASTPKLSKRSQEDPGQLSSPSPTASPNKRQKPSPQDGMQAAPANPADELQQSQPSAALSAAAAAAQQAIINRRRGTRGKYYSCQKREEFD